jgi:hypothetical protein
MLLDIIIVIAFDERYEAFHCAISSREVTSFPQDPYILLITLLSKLPIPQYENPNFTIKHNSVDQSGRAL